MSTKVPKKDWAFGPNIDRSKSSSGTSQRSPMLGEGSVPSTRVTRKPRSNPPKAPEIPEDKPITDDDVWVAIDSFFEENSLTATQIQSFNNFIHFGIPKVIAMNKYVKIEERGKSYQIEFGEHYIKTPRYSEMNQISRTLYPTEALWRNVTYASELLIDITITPPSGEASFHPKQFFGYIPVMVKSDLCNLTPIVNDQPRLIELGENIYDQGGYFIITPKGENSKATAQKKVVIPQERAAYNRIFIYNNRKSKPKYSIYAEIRCTPNNFNVATVCMGYCCRPSNKDRISCVLPWIDAKEIPLGIVFQALGINDVKDMALLCLGYGYENDRDALEILNRTLEFSYECKDQETALHFIGEKGRKTIRTEEKEDDEPLDIGDEDEIEEAEAALAKTKANAKAKSKKDEISYARHLLATDLFSHMPRGETGFSAKAKFLGHMTGYLISVILKRQTPEKRDHFMNKIVITTGTLCTYQFFSAFRKLVNDITSNAISALKKGNTVDIRSTIKAGVVTNTMFTAVNNSMWMAGGTTTKGISQPYDQYNYTAGIANTRKIALATEGGKSVEPRDLHPSHWGIICVTGDTEVVMADGSYCRMNQVNGKPVMSVNPTTLKHEPTGIYNFFSCVPESLLMITDDCGRTIKCTPDHPFLICTEGIFKWRRAKDLRIDDMIAVAVDTKRLLKEGKMVSRISKILDVPVEPVYDFTTISPNHSFIANGFVTHNCPAETPEGKSAGLTKAMALTSFITIETDPIPVKTIALHLLGDLEEKHHPESTLWIKVFLNGILIGATNTPNEFVVELVKRRRNADLSIQTSIAYFDIRKEIHISTEAGRLCRPLFVVENGELTFKSSLLEAVKNRELTWTKLLATGTIELIDSYEQESKLVAIHPSTVGLDHTHCELHPSLIYGVGGSIIPFLDHNQSPRNTYQCLWIEEPVLMKDLTTKKIKDIKIGDSVVTFHPQTLAITTTKVTHVRIAQTDKRLVRVTTTNNKSIIVTEDHKIMTLSGWKSAGEFGRREYVAMYPEASRIYKQVIFVLVKEVVEVSSVMIADITTKSSNHSFIGGEDFCVHNSAMGKQAVGIPFTNYRQVMTGKFHTLNYVQRPITLSRAAALVGFGDMPAGLNAVVAIISRECNEEDSIEMNQDSIDRGFMESTQWSHYRAEKNDDTTEFFGIPDSNLCAKLRGNFSKLSEEGYPKPGTKLISGDIVIGKYVKAAEGEKFQYINKSIIYEHMWPAVVDGIQKGYTADGYQYLTVSVAQLRTPIEGDKFCYSPDHEVLTMEGWLPITKITKNHKLATLGPEDNLEYHNPTEVVSFAYNGDMIEVETNQVSLKVTPNHNMYVRREIRKGKKKEFKLEVADTLFDKHVHYKKNAEWRCNGMGNFILQAYWHNTVGNKVILYPPKKIPIAPWLVFFGIWIAEGCAQKGRLKIAVDKQRVETALIKALGTMGYEYVIGASKIMEVHDKQLANYMFPLSVGAINKRLPSWAWELNKQQCQVLLESMCLGDGHMNGNTPMYDTSSVGLKDDVMRLALHCGWAANAHIKSKKGTHKIIRGKDTVTNADAWRITIVKTQLEPAVNKHIKNQQIKIPYKGKVYCCTVPNNTIYVRRTSRDYQKPVWSGNSARHGQKGVIGNKLRAVDLPFTSQGITPDICVNSLALPSRMTIAMLLEIYLGKIAAAGSPLNSITIKDMGLKVREHPDDPDPPRHSEEFKKTYEHPKYPGIIDATPFKRNFSIDLIKEEMRKLGCEYGDEYMTDGTTGQPLRVVVFQGLAYYQRLKHMVVEKAHARARGGRTTLTRQPKEGRAAGGGLRIGCMERDAILGQGAARFTRDRLMEQSDEFREPVCAVCGLYAKDVCMLCGGNNIQTIKIPFGTKLVQQELAAMNIVMRSSIEPYDPPLV